MAYYDEIKTASAQMHGLGCMSVIYTINIIFSCTIPIFVGLKYVRYLYPDLWGFICNQFKWEISQNICNGSPRYLELNQMTESGN